FLVDAAFSPVVTPTGLSNAGGREMCRVLRAALLTLMLLPPLAPAALGCTADADCDNGDTCSQPDHCVSGSCVLGGGGDADENLVCDAEFNPAIDIKVTKVVARTSALPGRDIIRGGGDFIDLGSAGGAFNADAGIDFRVKDELSSVDPPGDGFDVTVSFASTDCKGSDAALKCVRAGGFGPGSNAQFRRHPPAPQQNRLSVQL